MKKAEGLSILKALKKVGINEMSTADQFAVLDNIIALSEEAETIGKIEQAAKEKFVPKGFESKTEQERSALIPDINTKISDYLTPTYEAESEAKVKKLTDEGIGKIAASTDLNTSEKAILYKFLKS